jgi:hypothetical protein
LTRSWKLELSTLFCDGSFESMQHAEFANGVM